MKVLNLVIGLALLTICDGLCVGLAFGGQPKGKTLSADHSRTDITSITSFIRWGADAKLEIVCALTTKRDLPGKLPSEQHLTFYLENGKKRQNLFEFTTVYRLLNIYALGTAGGRLFTTWTGESVYPYHFHVFALIDGKIVHVLAIDSQLMPEILLDKNGNEIIMATEDKRTHIHKWDGTRYKFLTTVPWESRLEFVQEYVIAKELDLSKPQSVLSAVTERGAGSVVRKLTMNWDNWIKVLEGIESGATPWLEVARALRPGTDAFATTTLELAVAGALPKAPKDVLQLVGSGFALEDVCGLPQLEATRAEALQHLKAAESALTNPVDSELEVLRLDCLTRLRGLRAKYMREHE